MTEALEAPDAPTTPTTTVHLCVNGQEREFVCEDRTLLVHAIRDHLALKGTRIGCMNGDCGACSIKLNGEAVKSCLMLAASADGCEVTTVEGLADGDALTPLQQAMWEEDAFQCGFCVVGALFASQELLDSNETPDEGEIREALIGNLCRCTGYAHMVKAVQRAAQPRES